MARACYGLTPHRAASSWLAAHGRREACGGTHRTMAALSGRGSGSGQQRPRCSADTVTLVARLRDGGVTLGPRRGITGTRGRDPSRARTSRRSRRPEPAPGHTDAAASAESGRHSRRVSVHDRGNRTTAFGLSLTSRGSPPARNAGQQLAGYSCHAISRTARILHRLKDGETTLQPIRLGRVHEAVRLTWRSSVQRPRLHAAALIYVAS